MPGYGMPTALMEAGPDDFCTFAGARANIIFYGSSNEAHKESARIYTRTNLGGGHAERGRRHLGLFEAVVGCLDGSG